MACASGAGQQRNPHGAHLHAHCVVDVAKDATGHVEHVVAPGRGATDPAAQGVHACAPGADEKVPAGHGTHEVPCWKYPAWQTQELEFTAPGALVVLNMGHGMQDVELSLRYWPTGQGSQPASVAPV